MRTLAIQYCKYSIASSTSGPPHRERSCAPPPPSTFGISLAEKGAGATVSFSKFLAENEGVPPGPAVASAQTQTPRTRTRKIRISVAALIDLMSYLSV